MRVPEAVVVLATQQQQEQQQNLGDFFGRTSDISACAMSEVKLPVMDPRVPNLRQTKQNKTKQNKRTTTKQNNFAHQQQGGFLSQTMGNYGSSAATWLFPRPSTAVVPTATPDITTPSENNENIKRIDQTYQWILIHAPGVHPTHALAYAHLLFDAKLGNMDRIGRELAKEPQFLETLGFEADDAEEIFDSLRLAGLIGGGDNATLMSDVSSTHHTTHNNNSHQMALLKQQAKKLGPEHAITLSTVTNIGDDDEAH